MIRVLLVDDQDLVRAGLRGILREVFGFEVVGECADGSGVVSAVDHLRPDVVLMDVRMPVVDGIRATRQLRLHDGTPPVLALTTFDDDEVLAGVLRAGAAGFVLKGVPAEDLQQAVRVVANGGAWLDPAITCRVLAIYRAAVHPPAGPHTALDALTGREQEVLALIGRGQTNATTAAARSRRWSPASVGHTTRQDRPACPVIGNDSHTCYGWTGGDPVGGGDAGLHAAGRGGCAP